MSPAVEQVGMLCALELLGQGREVALVARGGSMRPFIQSGDRLTIKSKNTPLKVGEVIWARRGEVDVIHRVYHIERDGSFELRGDALPQTDGWFPADAYLGTIVAVERGLARRRSPDTFAHRCFVAFIRGLRHIEWKLNVIR
ncbi:MAG: S24/S26 family peptidase [Bradymonadia bacterium]